MAKGNSSGSLIWGARSIANHLGKSERATFHLLERGHLEPAARKVGKQWVLDPEILKASFRGAAMEAA